jgi:signal transduction histidine kinase
MPRDTRRANDERSHTDDSRRGERAESEQLPAAELAVAAEPHFDRGASRERALLDVDDERARTDATAVRDEFLAIASHDLRNILNNMMMFATLITDHVCAEERDEQVRKHAQRIVSSGSRMNRLIGDMLDVASIDSGRFEVIPDATELHPLLSEAVMSFEAAASAREVSLVSSIAPAPLAARFDATRMRQVLSALLSNAIAHSPAGGAVSVEAELHGDEVQLCVRDTGAGIAAAALEQIFDRFAHFATGGRRRLGLGLFISRAIVQAHGGRIWAESEVGHGAAFFVTLPRSL